MEKDEFEYRGHTLTVQEGGLSNGKKIYSYSIKKEHLAEEHYSRYSALDCYSLSEAAKAGRDAIDRAFASAEQLAAMERQLTKNDFDGFVRLLSDSKIPSEQIPALAIEILKAHYQRLNSVDTSEIASAINNVGGDIKDSFSDAYGNSLAHVLSGISDVLEEKQGK